MRREGPDPSLNFLIHTLVCFFICRCLADDLELLLLRPCLLGDSHDLSRIDSYVKGHEVNVHEQGLNILGGNPYEYSEMATR